MMLREGVTMASMIERAARRIGTLNTVACQLVVLILVMSLSACAVGPDYVKPKSDSPNSWNAEMKNGLQDDPVPPETLAKWWQTLNDPILTRLMAEMVTGNLDLQSARARVKEARARRGISRAGLMPVINGNAGQQTVRSKRLDTYKQTFDPRDLGFDEATLTALGLEPFEWEIDPNEANNGGDRTSESYTAGFDAAWEIDIFGGTRRAVEAANADLLASYEEFNSVLVSLLAETALNYIEVRTLQKRIDVAKANAKVQGETYQITQSRFRAGLADQMEIKGAQAALSGTRAQMPILKAKLDAGMNRLSVLLGKPPGKLHYILAPKAPIPVTPKEIAVGVPADALRRRPDVRQAERTLAAQTARIGVAKSELYPKLSLIGSLGYESEGTADLFDNANLASRFGPRLSWGLFKGGAVFQNINVQTARQEQALKRYQSIVLLALEEAEDALQAYISEQLRRDELIVANQASEKAFKLARNRYQSGLTDFNSVLLHQQSMLTYEDQLALSEGTVITNLIRLYKALGGGWAYQTGKWSEIKR